MTTVPLCQMNADRQLSIESRKKWKRYKIFQDVDGRWRTTVPDSTKKNKRRSIAKSTLEKLENAMIDF